MSRKVSIILLCSFVAVLSVGSLLNAEDTEATFIGEFCWNLSPYIDVLKVSTSAGGKQFELHGSLAAATYYDLTFTGSAFVGQDGQIVLGGFLSHDGAYFGGATGLSLHSVLGAGLTGTGVINGLDLPYTVSATLVPMPCPPGPATAEGTGRALGE